MVRATAYLVPGRPEQARCSSKKVSGRASNIHGFLATKLPSRHPLCQPDAKGQTTNAQPLSGSAISTSGTASIFFSCQPPRPALIYTVGPAEPSGGGTRVTGVAAS